MNATDFGLDRVFFLYAFDPGTNQVSYRFAGAREIAGYFHHEFGMSPLPRRIDDQGANGWRIFVQHDQGSMTSTGMTVTGANSQEALDAYYDAFLLRVINERATSPNGKKLFLCEGEKGLLWLLDTARLELLFRTYCPEAAESADSPTVMLEWLCYGVLSVPDYMAILSEVADRFPWLITDAQRVQLGMQIIEHKQLFG